MSAPAQSPRNVSTATAGATVFPYGFKILVKTDLQVQVDGEDKAVDVDYTVDGVAEDGGGNITFLTPLAGGEVVMRRRNMVIARTTDFQNLGDLRSATLNNDQDAPILMLQQHAEVLARALQLPADSSADATIPALQPGKALIVNAAGNGFEMGAVDVVAAAAAAEAAGEAADSAETAAVQAAAAAGSAGEAAERVTDAEAAQAAAEAAQAAAETARDVAQASGNIYADTTAGLGGTSDGDYFSVPSADDEQYLVLYLNDSGSAVAVKTYPSSEVVSRLDATEQVTTPKVDAMFGRYRYRDALGEFAYEIADAAGRVAWAITQAGQAYTPQMVAPILRDSSQVLWGVQDAAGKTAFGVQRDGSTLVNLLRVRAIGDAPRDSGPYRAALMDDAGKAVLGWNDAGEVDFLPSAALLGRIGTGVNPPNADGYYAFNLRGDGTNSYATVQAPDQSTYQVVSWDAGNGNQIAADAAPVEALLFYGQSNASAAGVGGTLVSDPMYPHHTFGFSAGVGQAGTAAVDPDTLSDLEPTEDSASGTAHWPPTLAGFALEWHRRRRGAPSRGVFTRSDFNGGQPLSAFVRDETTWDNLMATASKLGTVCGNYGRTAEVGALVWVQGEANGDDATYATALAALIDDLVPELMLQAGQASTPLFVMMQTNTYDASANGCSLTNLAQVSVAKARYGAGVILVGPMYQCPLSDDGFKIHPTPLGKMIYCELIALAYLTGPTFKPLWPTAATLVGSVITLTFDVPGDGLAFDTDWIAAADNYGFGYSDDGGTVGIDSVAIVGNTVEITLDGTPGANPIVSYGNATSPDIDDWATGRGQLYSPTDIPSYYASLGYDVPETIRHYCCKFIMEA